MPFKKRSYTLNGQRSSGLTTMRGKISKNEVQNAYKWKKKVTINAHFLLGVRKKIIGFILQFASSKWNKPESTFILLLQNYAESVTFATACVAQNA